MNKTGAVSPFDIASRFGYYILALMIISVLFLFFAVLIQGTQTTYYKNSFGTDVITLEERFFAFASYQDPLTLQISEKVIDIKKLRDINADENRDTIINNALGIYSQSNSHAIAYEVYYDTVEDSPSSFDFTSINFPTEPDFVKVFPVLLKDGDIEHIGYVKLSFGGFD